MEHIHISSHLINPLAIKICSILHKNEYQAFIVGGCVRDLLLNKTPKDWDICTDAPPNKIIEIFEKTIPTGLQHGTITVCMGEGKENQFEITTFRIEGEYKDGRRPEEVFFVMDVEKDLARRDLTINAMAYDPISHKLCDPFNGLIDLNNRLIKAVGDPSIRFQEDGLRIMRVARFAARFGYDVDLNTFNAMSNNLDTLKKVSKERIKDELCKTLMSEHSSFGMQLLFKSKVLDIVCPLLSGRQLPLLPFQDKCKGDLETKIAFLYNKIPAIRVNKELLNLKFSNKEIKRTMFLIDLLDKFYALQDRNNVLAYKNFIAFIKNNTPDTYEYTLNQFIKLSEALNLPITETMEKYKDEIIFSRKEMQINGDDLINAGISIGPRIKKCLDECYLEILRNPNNNTKYYLLEIARNY